MPFTFSCTLCGAKLKTPSAVPIGRPVQCPQCQGTFTLRPGDVTEVPQGMTPLPPPAAASRRDEDDRPRSRRDDDDYERGRGRRDEDDHPRRGRDDEDDQRGRGRRDEDDRRRRRDDDEDDIPRGRNRRYDDDWDRDRPRGKKRGNKGLMITLMIVSVLLIGGLIAGLIWYFSGSRNYDKEMLSYLPEGTMGVICVDISALMDVDRIRTQIESEELKLPREELSKLGIQPDDVSRVIVGLPDFTADKPSQPVAVVRFKKAIDVSKMVKELNAEKKEHEGKTYYKEKGFSDDCFYFPTDELVVFTKEEVMKNQVIKRDGNEVRLSVDLESLIKTVSKHPVWGAMAVNSKMRKEIKITDDMKRQAGTIAPKLVPVLDALPKAEGFVMFMDVDSKEMKLGIGMRCDTDETAKKISEAAKDFLSSGIEQMMNAMGGPKGGLPLPSDVEAFAKKTASNVKSDTDDDVGMVIITIDLVEAEALVNKYKKQFGGPPGRPNDAAPGGPGGGFGPPGGFPEAKGFQPLPKL